MPIEILKSHYDTHNRLSASRKSSCRPQKLNKHTQEFISRPKRQNNIIEFWQIVAIRQNVIKVCFGFLDNA